MKPILLRFTLVALFAIHLLPIRAQTAAPRAESTNDRVIAEELNLLASAVESSLTTCLEQLQKQSDDPIQRHTRMGEVYARLASNQCRNRARIINEVRSLRLSLQTFARSRFGERSQVYPLIDPIQHNQRGRQATHFVVWQVLIEELIFEGPDSLRSLELLRLANSSLVTGDPLGFWSFSGEMALLRLGVGLSYDSSLAAPASRRLWAIMNGVRLGRTRSISPNGDPEVYARLQAEDQVNGTERANRYLTDAPLRNELRRRATTTAQLFMFDELTQLEPSVRYAVAMIPAPEFLRQHRQLRTIDEEAYIYLRNLSGTGFASDREVQTRIRNGSSPAAIEATLPFPSSGDQ